MTPRASVVVCVHNREDQIGTCLASIQAQSCNDLELIVVDDASTDGTRTILSRYEATEGGPLVRVVRNAANLGVSGSRNEGIAVARGEFIAFTDSDCVVDQSWLERLLAPFRDQRVDAVSGRVDDVPARTYAERAYRGTCNVGLPGVQERGLVGCNMAFRARVLRQHLFDRSLEYGCDEDDVAFRIASAGGDIAYAPDARVIHNHPLTTVEYLRMGYRQGQGSARFWYKQRKMLGRDLVFLALSVATTPLIIAGSRWSVVPAAFLVLQLVALLFSETRFKSKSIGEAATVLPLGFAHSLVKLYSVLRTRLRIAIGLEPEIVVSRHQMAAGRRRS